MASDCLFCKIVAGDIPSTKVFEDDACIAFMDIGPVAEGHVLLIPKAHAATIGDMTAQDAAQTLGNLPKLVLAVQKAMQCEGINVLQNNGRLAGQLVDHVHFHIIPRSAGDAFEFTWPAGEYAEGRMDRLADAIRGNL